MLLNVIKEIYEENNNGVKYIIYSQCLIDIYLHIYILQNIYSPRVTQHYPSIADDTNKEVKDN